MVRIFRLQLLVVCAVGISPAIGSTLSGFFKLSRDEGRGFYRLDAFDSPEFVTVLKPRLNALGGEGLPERVRESNPERSALGSILIFSSHRPSDNDEFQATLHEVNCSVPGIPNAFYVASAGIRQTIMADPIGFFYPRVRQQIAAFRNGGGLLFSDKNSGSPEGIVGVGPRSLLLMTRDGDMRVSEIPFDSVTMNGNLFEAAAKLDLFLAYYCAHVARSGSSADLNEILPVVGSALSGEQDKSISFRRHNQVSLATRQTDDLIVIAGSADNTTVDRLVVVSKSSEEFSASHIGGMLASVAAEKDWQPAPSADGFAVAWDNATAGLRAVLNDRRNVFICTKAL
jgi:hypothetical protein